MKDQTFYTLLGQVGHRLTELRKSKGYTSHEDFARQYDLPRIQYWRLEKGKANFTIFTLMRILAIHNLSTIQFFNSIEGFKLKPVRTKHVAEKSELIIKDEHGMDFLDDTRL